MALINNIYVLVEDESVSDEVETVSHPTESGLPISDTVRKQPISLSLQGKIADTNSVKAETAIKKIKDLMKSGSLIKYVGQVGTLTNMQIQSFDTDYTNKNYGGADFSMSLIEIRTAKSAYVKPQKIESKKKTISVGDEVWFTGGYVYVSSDAEKHSSRRGASTCKLTLINDRSWAKHKYHLISVDGRGVYGWVDANKVSAISSKTGSSSNGGTQQIQSGKKDVIYHTVKKGDTIFGLVFGKYKQYNLSATEVMRDNPQAFSKIGDATTLQVDARLKLVINK